MKTKNQKNITKRLGIWAGVVALVLAIPLLFKFPWTMFDFVFAGVILFGSATVYEVATRNIKNKNQRYAVGAAVAAFIVLVWAWAVA